MLIFLFEFVWLEKWTHPILQLSIQKAPISWKLAIIWYSSNYSLIQRKKAPPFPIRGSLNLMLKMSDFRLNLHRIILFRGYRRAWHKLHRGRHQLHRWWWLLWARMAGQQTETSAFWWRILWRRWEIVLPPHPHRHRRWRRKNRNPLPVAAWKMCTVRIAPQRITTSPLGLSL